MARVFAGTPPVRPASPGRPPVAHARANRLELDRAARVFAGTPPVRPPSTIPRLFASPSPFPRLRLRQKHRGLVSHFGGLAKILEVRSMPVVPQERESQHPRLRDLVFYGAGGSSRPHLRGKPTDVAHYSPEMTHKPPRKMPRRWTSQLLGRRIKQFGATVAPERATSPLYVKTNTAHISSRLSARPLRRGTRRCRVAANGRPLGASRFGRGRHRSASVTGRAGAEACATASRSKP